MTTETILYNALKRLMSSGLTVGAIQQAEAAINAVEEQVVSQTGPDGWSYSDGMWYRDGFHTIYVCRNGQFWCPGTGMQSYNLMDCISSNE